MMTEEARKSIEGSSSVCVCASVMSFGIDVFRWSDKCAPRIGWVGLGFNGSHFVRGATKVLKISILLIATSSAGRRERARERVARAAHIAPDQ